MAYFRIEPIESGYLQMVVEGSVTRNDQDIFKAMSSLSKKRSPVILNLSDLRSGCQEFFGFIQELSLRTPIKVVSGNQEVVQSCVQNGISSFATLKNAVVSQAGDETLKKISLALRDFPILNVEAYQLAVYISTQDANFPDLEVKVRRNPNLAGQILRLANTAFFLRSGKAETLHQAFIVLGFANLRQIFLYNFYNSVSSLFKAQKEVIDHGRRCALVADFIARSAGSKPEECARVRIGALLHDIGKQVLSFLFPGQYEKVTPLARQKKIDTADSERLLFGVDHQAVGSMVCHRWNFPTYLSDIIGDHHFLSVSRWNDLTLPVFVANNFVNDLDQEPYQSYFQKLESYFALKKKTLPWKNVPLELKHHLESQPDVFSAS